MFIAHQFSFLLFHSNLFLAQTLACLLNIRHCNLGNIFHKRLCHSLNSPTHQYSPQRLLLADRHIQSLCHCFRHVVCHRICNPCTAPVPDSFSADQQTARSCSSRSLQSGQCIQSWSFLSAHAQYLFSFVPR